MLSRHDRPPLLAPRTPEGLCFSVAPGLSEKPSPQIYRELKRALDMTKALPGEFSVCFTELQQKFFHNRPRKLTDLILLVKHWYQQVTFQLRHLLPASVSFQARALTSSEVGPPGIQPTASLCPRKQHPDRHRTRSLRPSSRLRPSPGECPPPPRPPSSRPSPQISSALF